MTPMVVGLHLLLEARQPDRLAEGRLITSGTRAGAPRQAGTTPSPCTTCTISGTGAKLIASCIAPSLDFYQWPFSSESVESLRGGIKNVFFNFPKGGAGGLS